jgi:nucleoside-diphosphate-sugar epimerase
VPPLFGDGRQGTYHAAHAEVVTARELGEPIARALGRRVRFLKLPGVAARALLRATQLARSPGLPAPDKAGELLAPARRASCDVILRDTGWSAATRIADGIPTSAAVYRSAGWL